MNAIRRAQLRSFSERGFFIVRNYLPAEERIALREACDSVLEQTRSSSGVLGHITPHIELLKCDLDDARESLNTIVSFASSAKLCSLWQGLEKPEESGLPLLKQLVYYHEQTKHDWDGDWHRDSQLGLPDLDRERTRILTTTAVHVRVVLLDDDHLEIVPGSHNRWDTSEELQLRKGPQRTAANMPNTQQLALRAGDACVFHAWSIHRARYRLTPLRRSLDTLYVFRPSPRGAHKS